MDETQVYGVVLPVDVAHKARVIAAIEGKSRSRLMRDLLLEFLADYKSPTLPKYDSRTESTLQKYPHRLEETKYEE